MLLKIYFDMYKYIVVIVKGAEGSGEDEFRVLIPLLLAEQSDEEPELMG